MQKQHTFLFYATSLQCTLYTVLASLFAELLHMVRNRQEQGRMAFELVQGFGFRTLHALRGACRAVLEGIKQKLMRHFPGFLYTYPLERKGVKHGKGCLYLYHMPISHRL